MSTFSFCVELIFGLLFRFLSVDDVYEPVDDGATTKVRFFIG